MIHKPKISIVTPSYNSGKYIRETIKSVLSQDYNNFEYFVIDGASTDSTVEILKEFENDKKYKDKFRWLSEKDKGQTDAVNKGLRMCTGDWFAFLNADDYYEQGVFSKLAPYMKDNMDKGVIYGNCWNVFDGLDSKYNILSIPKESISQKAWSRGNHIYGPASFYNMKALKKVGEFDITLYHWMDWDMYARIAKIMEMKYVNINITNFRIVKDQKSPMDPALRHTKANKYFMKEAYLVSRKHGGKRYSRLWAYKFWFYREYRYFRRKVSNIKHKRKDISAIGIKKQKELNQ